MTVCFSHKIRKIEHLSATMAEMCGQGQDQNIQIPRNRGNTCKQFFFYSSLFHFFDIYHLEEIALIYIK